MYQVYLQIGSHGPDGYLLVYCRLIWNEHTEMPNANTCETGMVSSLRCKKGEPEKKTYQMDPMDPDLHHGYIWLFKLKTINPQQLKDIFDPFHGCPKPTKAQKEQGGSLQAWPSLES